MSVMVGRAKRGDSGGENVIWTNGLATVTADGQLRLALHYGQEKAWNSTARFILVTAGTQSGKALALDTPIPTPDGWREMGELRVGDTVIGSDGKPARVTYVSPIYRDRNVYRVVFEDGEVILADEEHLWHAKISSGRWAVRTTKEILTLLERGKRVFVPVARPFDGKLLPDPLLTEDEYYLAGFLHAQTRNGVWGRAEYVPDGVAAALEAKFGEFLERRGERTLAYAGISAVDIILHEPRDIALAPLWAKEAFLRGVFDSVGEFSSDSVHGYFRDAEAARTVVSVLAFCGIRAKFDADTFVVRFVPEFNVFEYSGYREDCAEYLEHRGEAMRERRSRRKRVVSVEPLGYSVPVRCISVDNEDASYLAGRYGTTTHNTSFGPWWLWREIMARGSGDYLAVATNYDLYKLKILPEMLRVFEEILKIGRWWPGERIIELRDPSTGKFWAKRSTDPMWGRVLLRSAAAPESLESATAKGAWLDEVGQDSWDVTTWEAILRRLSLHRGRVLMTTTVYNSGWLKSEVYDRALAGDSEYEAISFPSIANPSFPREEFERAKRTMPRWRFEMFYLGKFSKPAGLIYGDFDRDTMVLVRDNVRLNPQWRYIVGIDFGGANTAAIFMAYDDEYDRWIVFDEYRMGGVSTDVHVANIQQIVGDFYDVQYVGGAPGETQYRMDWQSNGLPVEQPPISEVEVGVSMVVKMIRGRRLYVTDNCRGLLHELASYRRKLAPDGVTPLNEIDNKNSYHRLDALRYAVTVIGQEETAGDIFLY